MRPPIARWLSAALASAALIGAVTAVIALLEPRVPALGLGVLYLLAVVPIALVHGLVAAGAVSVASTAAFNFFFLPPRYSLDPGTSEQWEVLVAFLVSSLVVSALAVRSQREARRSARLADEQAALRRVATLVARGVPSPELFAAVGEEVARVFPVENTGLARYEPDGTMTTVAISERLADSFPVGSRWPLGGKNVSTVVFETGRSARIDTYGDASGRLGVAMRERGLTSAVGAPIVVEGHVWGVLTLASTEHPLPADTETRLASFAELLATAIANAESRAGVTRLAADQAALRRVATLVARASPPEEVFAAVAEEVGRLLPVDFADLGRCEPDGTMTFLAAWGKTDPVFPVGARLTLGGRNVTTLVAETGSPARVESYADASGPIGAPTRETGVRSAVGTPITVAGRLWGVMAAGWSLEEPMPPDTEARLAQFTDLLETAIANAESRAGLARLATEQAALRQVATLVAEGARPEEMFAAVANEVGRLLSVDLANVGRYEDDGTVTFVASAGGRTPVGSRWPLGETNLATLVLDTGRPARIDNYAEATGPLAEGIRAEGIRSAVGTPIVVEGRLWGLMTAGSSQEQPLPPDTEARLASFTELVATAIANTEARTQVGQLADEQAALRRVATLVARGMPAAEVFSAVAAELERHLDAQATTIGRLEPDRTLTIVASSGSSTDQMPMGTRLTLESGSVLAEAVLAGRAVRVDDYSRVTGLIREVTQRTGIRCSVAVPIMVEGSLWGSMGAGTQRPQFPADAEQRMAEFTELVATAISNIQAREDLAASRARIVAAADDERRRVVRDLHDGAQQRLVHTVITLKLARSAFDKEADGGAPALVDEALQHAQAATAELRELAHGILPAILTRGGLRAGVDALASRMPVPVAIDTSIGRLPAPVEATAYFVVAEALTNVAKHAHADHAEVTARIEDGTLAVQVRDDGVGGAQRDGGGLIGLADRLAALGGELKVESPAHGGTLVAAAIPLPD